MCVDFQCNFFSKCCWYSSLLRRKNVLKMHDSLKCLTKVDVRSLKFMLSFRYFGKFSATFVHTWWKWSKLFKNDKKCSNDSKNVTTLNMESTKFTYAAEVLLENLPHGLPNEIKLIEFFDVFFLEMLKCRLKPVLNSLNVPFRNCKRKLTDLKVS